MDNRDEPKLPSDLSQAEYDAMCGALSRGLRSGNFTVGGVAGLLFDAGWRHPAFTSDAAHEALLSSDGMDATGSNPPRSADVSVRSESGGAA